MGRSVRFALSYPRGRANTAPARGRDVTAGYDIGLAAGDDIEGILELQDRNQPDRGGTLSARLPRAWFEAALAAMPVVVARREGRVVGCLVASPLAAPADVPVVRAMLAAARLAASGGRGRRTPSAPT